MNNTTLIEIPSIAVASACAFVPPLIAAGTLTAIGFTVGGVAYGSLAAAWMSSIGNVPAGSLFASLQSTGTLGPVGLALSPPVLALEVAAFSAYMYVMEKESIDAFMANAQRDILDYIHSADLSGVTSNLHIYLHNNGTHFSVIDQKAFDSIKKHSKKNIHVLGEKTRIHRENFMKSTNSFISAMNSKETADFIRQHSIIIADSTRVHTENAINAANSFLSTVNTQETIDHINKKSQEAIEALEENTREHRQKVVDATNSYLAKGQEVAENAISAANSLLSKINTQENIDLVNKHSKEAIDALEEKTRLHREKLKNVIFEIINR